MNKTIAAGIAGAVFAAILFGLSSFQFVAPLVDARHFWPPRPDRILNWNALEEFGAQVTVPSGSDVVLITVPNDMWLVITNGGALGVDFNVYERLSGIDTLKVVFSSYLIGNAGAVGVKFAPGSEVVVRNTHSFDRYLGKSTTILGYFSR